MQKSLLIAFLITVNGISYPAADNPTLYSNSGIPNPDVYNFTALSTGELTGFFAGVSAADTSVVGVSINGGTPATSGLNNQTTALGQFLASNPDGPQHISSLL